MKRFHILVQHHRRQPPFVAVGAHVVLVAHLQDNFVKRFFLFAGADFFIVVFYPPVCPGLFGVVAFQGLVKEFMVHRLDILLAVCYIQMGAFRVGILSVKLPAVVVHRPMPHHGANRPFQSIPPFPPRQRRAFVTFCESNAKALLTAYRPSKAHLRPTGWCGGFAPAVCGRLPQQGRPLKRAPCTPPKLFHSPWGREERPAAFPPTRQVFSVG